VGKAWTLIVGKVTFSILRMWFITILPNLLRSVCGFYYVGCFVSYNGLNESKAARLPSGKESAGIPWQDSTSEGQSQCGSVHLKELGVHMAQVESRRAQ
jgi:hypothetical protein